MPTLWSQDVNIRVTGEEPQGKVIMCKMDIRMREKINKFCILNLQAMEKWLEAYEEDKQQGLRESGIFRRSQQTTRTSPYPEHLQILLEFPTGKWIDTTISQAKHDGLTITDEEVELTLGCDWHVGYVIVFFLVFFEIMFI